MGLDRINGFYNTHFSGLEWYILLNEDGFQEGASLFHNSFQVFFKTRFRSFQNSLKEDALQEGGLRRPAANRLASKATASDVKFFAALADVRTFVLSLVLSVNGLYLVLSAL